MYVHMHVVFGERCKLSWGTWFFFFFFFGSRASIEENNFHLGWDSGSLSVFFFLLFFLVY
jgi:hypothetical protein